MTVFRYDLASLTEPRVILITEDTGKRSDVPRLGYVVIPQQQWVRWITPLTYYDR